MGREIRKGMSPILDAEYDREYGIAEFVVIADDGSKNVGFYNRSYIIMLFENQKHIEIQHRAISNEKMLQSWMINLLRYGWVNFG